MKLLTRQFAILATHRSRRGSASTTSSRSQDYKKFKYLPGAPSAQSRNRPHTAKPSRSFGWSACHEIESGCRLENLCHCGDACKPNSSCTDAPSSTAHHACTSTDYMPLLPGYVTFPFFIADQDIPPLYLSAVWLSTSFRRTNNGLGLLSIDCTRVVIAMRKSPL